MKSIKNFFSYLFVPNEQNNFRAKSLHLDFLTGYLVFAFLFVFLIKNYSVHLNNVLGFATDVSVQKLYELTNEERTKNHLQPLTYNKELAQAAQLKADDMFKRNYWAHFAPDGTTPWNFIQ